MQRLALLVFLLIPMTITIGLAQDRTDFLNSLDLQNISQADIQNIRNKIQSEGLTLDDVLTRARSAGLSADQILDLQGRLGKSISSDEAMSGESDRDTNVERYTQDRISDINLAQPTSSQRKNNHILFGSSYFTSGNSALEATFQIPTPQDYQLGTGDEIIIQIWGDAEARYVLPVDREGVVRISGIGPVYVNGLTISEARDRLTTQLSRIYSGLTQGTTHDQNNGTYIEILLGNVRTIRVSVIGETVRPGTYTVSSLSTVFNALYASGGPSSMGSYREVEVIRNNSTISTLDLYNFMLRGDLEGNIRLQDQDIIHIKPYKNHIFLYGEVKRPAVYELKDGETIEDLFEFAAGFTEQAFTRRIVIERNTDFQRRIEDVVWPKESNTLMQDGDRLVVQPILDRYENRVTIDGAVYKPGAYQLEDGMTVKDLIAKAEGLREDVFLNRALLTRTTNQYQKELISFSLREVMDVNENSRAPITLQNDDVLMIYSAGTLKNTGSVRVTGAVKSPNEFSYVDGVSLNDAILMAGGFTFNAANYNIEVSRFVLETDQYEKQNNLVESFIFEVGDDFALSDVEFPLLPFDIITVREQPNNNLLGSVQVIGEVNFPGSYVLHSRLDRISDIVRRAGDLSQFAYPEGATLQRTQNRGVERQVAQVIEEQVEFSRNDNIAIDLVQILRTPGSDEDLLVQPGDRIVIPKESNTVTVEGEVLYPVIIRYDQSLSFNDYIEKAGGYTEEALDRNVYVIYADGDVKKVKRSLFGRRNPKIAPGATIIVPTKQLEEELLPQERIAIYSAIISMAAIVTNTIFQIIR